MKYPELERLHREFGWKPSVVPSGSGPLWELGRDDAQKSSFSDAQFDSLEAGADGWWYQTRNLILKDALSSCDVSGALWDVGSGSGAVARFLKRAGREVMAIEPGGGGAAVSARSGVPSFCATLEQLSLPTSSLNAVGMFDVLEHVEDRAAVLKEIKRVLQPGAHLLLTLPALRLLWSDSDVTAGHFLRYSRRSIRRELENAGFTIVRSRYFFGLTVLPLLVLRAIPHRIGRKPLVTDEELVAKDIGFVGRIALHFERQWARVGFVGSSLLVVAKAN